MRESGAKKNDLQYHLTFDFFIWSFIHVPTILNIQKFHTIRLKCPYFTKCMYKYGIKQQNNILMYNRTTKVHIKHKETIYYNHN